MKSGITAIVTLAIFQLAFSNKLLFRKLFLVGNDFAQIFHVRRFTPTYYTQRGKPLLFFLLTVNRICLLKGSLKIGILFLDSFTRLFVFITVTF